MEMTGRTLFTSVALQAHQGEIRARRQHRRGAVHNVFVRHVAIGEDDLFDLLVADQTFQFFFFIDGDAFRVQRSGQLGGITPPADAGDLCRGEGDDLG